MDKVKLSKLEAAVKELRKHSPLEDIEVSFEYLIGSFYPNVLQNIHDEVQAQYTKGYTQGYADGKAAKKK